MEEDKVQKLIKESICELMKENMQDIIRDDIQELRKLVSTTERTIVITERTEERVSGIEKKIDALSDSIREETSRQAQRITANEVQIDNLDQGLKNVNNSRKEDAREYKEDFEKSMKEHKDSHWKFIVACIGGAGLLLTIVQLIFMILK